MKFLTGGRKLLVRRQACKMLRGFGKQPPSFARKSLTLLQRGEEGKAMLPVGLSGDDESLRSDTNTRDEKEINQSLQTDKTVR